MNRNSIICGDNVDVLRGCEDEFFDLTVTSPPYDNLRTYNGYSFDFEGLAEQLFRVTKIGGVVVWIIADETKNGTESGTSFRQALFFKEIGFNLYDTMIWNKGNCGGIGSLKRYENVFEYMFIFSKDKPKSSNVIKDKPNKRAGEKQHGSIRQKDGSVRKTSQYGKRKVSEYGRRHNIWSIPPEKSAKKRLHPAPFPEAIAQDHIISWSNKGDLILDPFCGSGTTLKMAKILGRDYIGIDISQEYCNLSQRRVDGI